MNYYDHEPEDLIEEFKSFNFTYNGNCYYCEEKKLITNPPIGDIRLCKSCLCRMGRLFLESLAVGKTKGCFINKTTLEILVKTLKIVGEAGNVQEFFNQEE